MEEEISTKFDRQQFQQQPTFGSSHYPIQVRQLNYNSNEFDNYSQVLTDDNDGSCAMSYGDIDVTSHQKRDKCQQIISDTNSLPFSLKTNTQHGSILAGSNGAGNHLYSHQQQNMQQDALKNMYRAVEYTKGKNVFNLVIVL